MTKRVFPVVMVLVCAWLAGCSDRGAPDAEVAGVLRDAAAASVEQETVRFEIRPAVAEPGDPSIEGVMDFVSRRVAVTMNIDDVAVDIVFLDDAMYLRADGILGSGDDPTGFEDMWFLVSGDEYGDVFAGDQPAFLSDPREAFALLTAEGGNPENLGQEDVRNTPTTHYRVTVPIDIFLKVLGLDESLVALDGVSEAPVEAWVDDDGLLRRLQWQQSDFWGPDEGAVSETVVIEYWDYGVAPHVELPDEGQVIDLGAWIGADDDSFGFADPFEEADCYGDDIDNCLAPNPEVDAVAVDPAVCQGPEALVCLVPVGDVRLDVLQAIVDFHRETAGIEVVILPSLPVDPASIDRTTSQVTEWGVFRSMQDAYGIVDDMPSTFIGITPIDMRPEDGRWGWEFGARFGRTTFGYNHGVFSYFRPANVEPYDGSPLDDALLFERSAKYVARYVSMLYLDYPMGQDINYLNYYEMYGFSDLDSMGTKWPDWPNPCVGDEPIVCIVPDGDYLDWEFKDDTQLVAERLSEELGIRVDVRGFPSGYAYPTQESWSDEYYNDLHDAMGALIDRPNVTVIGLTDDRFAQIDSVVDHVGKAWPEERFAVASGYAAGKPGTELHQELLYRVLLRAIAQAKYGVPLDDDPGSLMFSGAQKPEELAETAVPVLK